MAIDTPDTARINIKDIVLKEPFKKPEGPKILDPVPLVEGMNFDFLETHLEGLDKNPETGIWNANMEGLASLRYLLPEKIEGLDLETRLGHFITEVPYTLRYDNRSFLIPPYISHLALLFPKDDAVRQTIAEFTPE